jgi:hypothetical protein
MARALPRPRQAINQTRGIQPRFFCPRFLRPYSRGATRENGPDLSHCCGKCAFLFKSVINCDFATFKPGLVLYNACLCGAAVQTVRS